jgi:hypothetical protein
MAPRNEYEKDFDLKVKTREILWAQGYSTRLDVLLALELDPRGRAASGKAGLTDIDVFGIRLDPGFQVRTGIADCKTVRGKVPERLFWLAGVSKFFASDGSMLVRSTNLPDHAIPLARSLDISLVGPDDLAILHNTYVPPSYGKDWDTFHSSALQEKVLSQIGKLPSAGAQIDRYREFQFWMEPRHLRLQHVPRTVLWLERMGENTRTTRIAFADLVWMYVLALWQAMAELVRNGLTRLERGLELYLSGYELGMDNLVRLRNALSSIVQEGTSPELPLLPPYAKDLQELIVRCVRRPEATGRLARRAEWLLSAQLIGGLGPPPWPYAETDVIADKLLGDTARFLARATGLDRSILDSYLSLLAPPPVPPLTARTTVASVRTGPHESPGIRREELRQGLEPPLTTQSAFAKMYFSETGPSVPSSGKADDVESDEPSPATD